MFDHFKGLFSRDEAVDVIEKDSENKTKWFIEAVDTCARGSFDE